METTDTTNKPHTVEHGEMLRLLESLPKAQRDELLKLAYPKQDILPPVHQARLSTLERDSAKLLDQVSENRYQLSRQDTRVSTLERGATKLRDQVSENQYRLDKQLQRIIALESSPRRAETPTSVGILATGLMIIGVVSIISAAARAVAEPV